MGEAKRRKDWEGVLSGTVRIWDTGTKAQGLDDRSRGTVAPVSAL